MIYRVLAALTLLASASASLYRDDPSHQKYLWETFKRDFNKAYGTMDEETRRFTIFLENLKMADLRAEQERKAGGSAMHGITKFSDLSQAEFEAHLLTSDVSMKSKNPTFEVEQRTADATLGLVDWSGKLTTPVKDQVILFKTINNLETFFVEEVGTNIFNYYIGILWLMLGFLCY